MTRENDFGVFGLSQDEVDEMDEESWEKFFYPGGIIDLIGGQDDRYSLGRLLIANF